MNCYLFDLETIVSLIKNKDLSIPEGLCEIGAELYLTSSMIPQITKELSDSEKSYFASSVLKYFHMITSTGQEGMDSLNYSDSESVLSILSFRRVCPEGAWVSRLKNLPLEGIEVYRPDEVLAKAESNAHNKHTISLPDLKKEYRFHMPEIDQSLLQAVSNAQYIQGPQVKELEDRISQYIDVSHCVATSSGTEALVLALRAFAIKNKGQEFFSPDDEIITSPLTFTATGEAILRSGATPVFIDIDPDTYNLNTSQVQAYLENNDSKVVGIIPVHLYGRSCNMDHLLSLSNDYNLFILEDVAQGFGGTWKNKKLGSLGHAGAFSFFPSKTLGGFGDGGLTVCQDDELATLIRMLGKHGGKDKYNVDHIGYNARLDTLQAAVLLTKLDYLDDFNESRRKIASTYSQELSHLEGLKVPQVLDGHVFHQYTIRVLNGRRDSLQNHLNKQNIMSRIYYPVSLDKMKVFKSKYKQFKELKESNRATQEILSLPIGPYMSQDDINTTVSAVKSFFE